MKRILIISAFATALCAQVRAAEPGQAEQFKTAIATYEATLASPTSAEHKASAKEAYQLAKELYPQSEALGQAALNYARTLDQENPRGVLEAVATAQAIKQKLNGKFSPEMVDVYLVGGRASSKFLRNPQVTLGYYVNAIKIAKRHIDDELALGSMNLEAGEALVAVDPGRSMKYFKDASKAFRNAGSSLQREVLLRVEVGTGQAYYYQRNYKSAEKPLLAVLEMQDAANPNKEVAMSAHLMLANVYDNLERPDEITPHVVAVGRYATELNLLEKGPPVVIGVRPNYPSAARDAQGWVQLRFNLDESGFVHDAEVEDIEGSDAFRDTGLAAIKNYRFGPSFADGQPVPTEGVQYVFRFTR